MRRSPPRPGTINKAADREPQMNPAFITFLSAAAVDRRDAFLGAAQRLGAPEQNIEKDFWVCWTLDALFNGAKAGGPRLLFKGGTSLSKAFGLISRFSEDIDIAIFRDDLGEAATVDELEALSGKKRRRRLDAIKGASQAYVNESMRLQVEGHLREALETAGLEAGAGRVEPDPDDPDRQSLLIWYPKVTAADEGYVRPAVKIESGAKSALDPNQPAIVKPYVADVLADLELSVPDVRTVVADHLLGQGGDLAWFAPMVRRARRAPRRRSADFTALLRRLPAAWLRCRTRCFERFCAWRRLRAARPYVLQQSRSEPRGCGARFFHALAKRADDH